MIGFIKMLTSVLAVADLKFVVAQDGNNVSMMVLPKSKTGETDYPSLNLTFDINSGTDEELAAIIVEKLKRSLPMISNINAFEKAMKETEGKAKDKAAKAGKTDPKKPAAPKVEKKEDIKEEEEKEEEENNDDETAEEETPKTTAPAPQPSLF